MLILKVSDRTPNHAVRRRNKVTHCSRRSAWTQTLLSSFLFRPTSSQRQTAFIRAMSDLNGFIPSTIHSIQPTATESMHQSDNDNPNATVRMTEQKLYITETPNYDCPAANAAENIMNSHHLSINPSNTAAVCPPLVTHKQPRLAAHAATAAINRKKSTLRLMLHRQSRVVTA